MAGARVPQARTLALSDMRASRRFWDGGWGWEGGVRRVFNARKSGIRNAIGRPEISCRNEKENATEQFGRAEGEESQAIS